MTNEPDQFDIDVDLSTPEGSPEPILPYTALVVGNMAGGEGGRVSGPLCDGIVEVTADSFDTMMREASPGVELRIADPTRTGSVMAEVTLHFDSLRAFQPRDLVRQIPEANLLGSLREKVVDRLLGKLPAEQLSAAATQAVSSRPHLSWLTDALGWSPARPAPPPQATEALLDGIDLGDSPPASSHQRPKTPLGELVAAAAGGESALHAEEASALRHALAEMDKRITSWLTAVLHSPQVQTIEAAWRSLAFLVSHTEFRKGIRLRVLHADRSNVLERVRSLLVDPVFDEAAPAPDLIIMDMSFGQTAGDIEVLDEMAQHAASLPAVILAGVSPSFFGVKHAWQVPTLPAIISLFDQWQFAKWKTLRDQPYAQSLGVVFGRGLLRAPYSREEAAELEFAYREPCISDQDLVWASGAIAAGCAVARSLADTGWPVAMSGYVHGRVEGFTIAEGGPKGDKRFGPTDTLTPLPKIEELAAGGVNALVGVRDHSDGVLWNGLTAAKPRRRDPNGFLEVSLHYQLFATRLSTLLFSLRPRLLGMPPDDIVATVTRSIRGWLGIESQVPPEQLVVRVEATDAQPAVPHLVVSVVPPTSILPGGIPVVLGYRLG